MSNRADATTQVNADNAPEQNYETKVNEVVLRMTKNDKGSWELPEDIEDEGLRFSAMAERRRRDTQSDYTRIAQKAKALEAEKNTLVSKIIDSPILDLSPEQKEELDQLKFSEPDEWRKRLGELEREIKAKRKASVDEDLSKVSSSTLETEETERRKQVLAQFNESHPDFIIDDDFIANEIPPRIVKKLADGKVTFEEFLQECFDYSTKGKVVKQETTPTQVNLSKMPGGSRPDNKAVKEDVISSYRKETY